ncbi:MAG TPA: hypothetical protein VNR64_05955 [Vicinamibacterales bacterium]|nr:hypothetical protein [Vicinamibacterales bacterium]
MTRYLVPTQCTFCGRSGHVAVAARTRDGRVGLCWHCGDCDGEWPVKQDEQLPERRSGVADRRRRSRRDRRNPTG